MKIAVYSVFAFSICVIVFIVVSQIDLIFPGLFSSADTAPVVALADQSADEEADITEQTEEPTTEPTSEPTEEPTPEPTPELTTEPTEEPIPTPEPNPLAAFDYYIADKEQEYRDYWTLNPELTAEDVVWMVNTGLNRDFFEDPVEITDEIPLLINPYNKLPDDFVPAELADADGAGRQLTPETISAFRKMRDAAALEGYTLAIASAYRTIEYQRGLRERAGKDGAVARAAFSEHHTGRTLDLAGPDGLLDENGTTPRGLWVAEHAHEYGFIVRYTEENTHITSYIPEPWHITYVGSAIANDIRDGGYGSLEEYVAKNPGVKLTMEQLAGEWEVVPVDAEAVRQDAEAAEAQDDAEASESLAEEEPGTEIPVTEEPGTDLLTPNPEAENEDAAEEVPELEPVTEDGDELTPNGLRTDLLPQETATP
jgi:D-alanyl-D-alanine carboxypeptidase